MSGNGQWRKSLTEDKAKQRESKKNSATEIPQVVSSF